MGLDMFLERMPRRKTALELPENVETSRTALIINPAYVETEEIGYWRKANAIHKWFVDKVQDGIDDCEYHHEVTKEILEELLSICQRIINSVELKEGFHAVGSETDENGNVIIDMVEEKYIENVNIAKELLPTQGGFFFGDTEYNEWYLRDIENTIKIVCNALETTDFENEVIYYCSSW